VTREKPRNPGKKTERALRKHKDELQINGGKFRERSIPRWKVKKFCVVRSREKKWSERKVGGVEIRKGASGRS